MTRSPLTRKHSIAKHRKKVSSHESIAVQIDKQDSKMCRYLAGKCAKCGSEENLEMHHIIIKYSNWATRFLTENHICLCRECHREGPNCIHQNRTWSDELKAERGLWKVNGHRPSIAELQELLTAKRAECRELTGAAA